MPSWQSGRRSGRGADFSANSPMMYLPRFLIVVLFLGCGGCVGMDKPPAAGGEQDLIVAFDDAAIRRQAEELNKQRGLSFDDSETLSFKAERYADLKKNVLSALPPGDFAVLKDYPALPSMFLRFRSKEALRALLAHPSVIGVHEDRKEAPMRH